MIEVPSIGERPPRRLSRQTLAEVVEPRYEELLNLALAELRRTGLEAKVASGVVMTGGSSKMAGLMDLAEEIFHMPVRLGHPQNAVGLEEVMSNPIHATGVGLLLYARQNRFALRSTPKEGQGLKAILGRMKNWFQGNF